MEYSGEKIDWNGKAGQRLDELTKKLPSSPRLELIIFGSAPLQLLIERAFLSEDIDIFNQQGLTNFLDEFVRENKWNKGETEFYIEIVSPLVFRSTSDWQLRAIRVERNGHLLIFVHPWDILASKLQRLDEKDLKAFRLVLEKTGHPTEEEFARHLQKAVDLYRPKFDEESNQGDMLLNTQVLWKEIWNKDIDVRVRIIRPALERLNEAYRQQNPDNPSLKTRLANLRLPK